MELDIDALRRRTRQLAMKSAKVASAAAEQGRAFFRKLSQDFEPGAQEATFLKALAA